MRNTFAKGLALACVLACAPIAACGGGETQNNATTGGNNTEANKSTGNADANKSTENMKDNSSANANMQNVMFGEQYQLRFTEMKFVTDGTDLKAELQLINNLIKTEFDPGAEEPIIVLVDVKDIDGDAGTMGLRAGAGVVTATDGEYEWHEDTGEGYVDGTIDGAGKLAGKLPNFQFIASVNGAAVPLPIEDLEFTGTLTPDDDGEGWIMDGFIAGYLTEETGDTTKLEIMPGAEPVPISTVLKKEKLNLDTDDDGTPDAWALEASFVAEPCIIED